MNATALKGKTAYGRDLTIHLDQNAARLDDENLKSVLSEAQKGLDAIQWAKAYQKQEETEDGLIHFVASSEVEDRDGDVIRQDGWILEDFDKNPIFQWAHDSGFGSTPAIGTIPQREVRGGQALHIWVRFAGEYYPFAQLIKNLYLDGILNAVSVGFIPREMQIMVDEEGNFTGAEFITQELLEVSAVNIPANQDALIQDTYGQEALDMLKQAEDPAKVKQFKGYDDFIKSLDGFQASAQKVADACERAACACGGLSKSGIDVQSKDRRIEPKFVDIEKGPTLGGYLNSLVNMAASEDRPRSEIIGDIAQQAGRDRSTIRAVLRGEVQCPPIETLEAFAVVLNEDVERIISAGEADGCDYRSNEESNMLEGAVAQSLDTNILKFKGVPSLKDWPLAERDASWNGDAAESRIREWASSDGSGDKDTIQLSKYRPAHALYDDEADEFDFEDFKAPMVDIFNSDGERDASGSPRYVPQSIFTIAALIQGAQGGLDYFQEGDESDLKRLIERLYARMREAFDDDSLVPPWEREEEGIGALTVEEFRSFLNAFGMGEMMDLYEQTFDALKRRAEVAEEKYQAVVDAFHEASKQLQS